MLIKFGKYNQYSFFGSINLGIILSFSIKKEFYYEKDGLLRICFNVFGISFGMNIINKKIYLPYGIKAS